MISKSQERRLKLQNIDLDAWQKRMDKRKAEEAEREKAEAEKLRAARSGMYKAMLGDDKKRPSLMEVLESAESRHRMADLARGTPARPGAPPEDPKNSGWGPRR